MRLILLLSCLLLAGCQSLVRNATGGLAAQLGSAVENHDDPDTVAAGLPAYLLLLDGLIEGDPQGSTLLVSAARLYAAYAGSFVDEPERARRLASRALGYAERAFCPRAPRVCQNVDASFADYEAALAEVSAREAELLLSWASARASWVQAHSEDWAAIAGIPAIQAALERVQVLRPGQDQGLPELYLGVLNTLLPESFGGRPELGRRQFERALELSGGRNQMARVLLAERYARLVFDRELHDRVLREALAPLEDETGFRLVNRLAQARARELLESSADYFGDFEFADDLDETLPPW